MFCDLHTHSSASDGTDAPEALPSLARAAGLAAIALTDHDTAAGLPAAAAAAAELGVGFVPGIELSADPGSIAPPARDGDDATPPRGTLHVLGYFIRADDPHLARIEARLKKARAQRNPEMVDRLNELEFVPNERGGEVLANIWLTPRIARIDPATGNVTGWIDLTQLVRQTVPGDVDAVLNGIAYDQATDRLFVTGKNWPRLYEIDLVPAAGQR